MAPSASRASQIHTETLLVSSALHARPPTASSPLKSILHHLSFPTSLSLRAPSPPPAGYPRYALKLSYVQLSSGGKSLIHEGVRDVEEAVAGLFDKKGRLWNKGVEEKVEDGVRGVLGL